MSDGTILAAHTWPTNAALIADVAQLGYLDGHVCDPTYGRGNWWKAWQPERLTAHDLNPEKSPTGESVDFRCTGHPTASFDAITFDPPYMAPGGRKNSTIADFNDRFGLHTTPRTPALNQESINDGITEAYRILKPGGFLLVKCMDYINGGKLWPGTHLVAVHATSIGFTIVDRFEHVGVKLGPQPERDRQLHARRNLSTLFVFQRDNRAAGQGTLL